MARLTWIEMALSGPFGVTGSSALRISGAALSAAMDAIEELEEAAKLFLLLHGRDVRPLSLDQVGALAAGAAVDDERPVSTETRCRRLPKR